MRRLALPKIPIQFTWRRRRRKRARIESGRQVSGRGNELSDSSVAHEFACESEALRAALLRAGLENAFVFSHGSDDVSAFVDRER
jgi:hypothetical protein